MSTVLTLLTTQTSLLSICALPSTHSCSPPPLCSGDRGLKLSRPYQDVPRQ